MTAASKATPRADHERRFRDLALALIWRDIIVRYKRSVLGILWALAEPLFIVIVYTIVFGHILGAAPAAGGASYPFFVVFGVLPWLYFSSTAESAASTLLEHASLARKVSFPWEILILAVLASRLTTLLIGCAAGILAAVAVALTFEEVAFIWSRLPLMLLGVVLLSAFVCGVALVAAALFPLLRDTAFLLRFVLRLAFYACPVVYATTMVPERFRFVYELNPLVGMLWLFQAFTVAAPAPGMHAFLSSILSAVVSLVGGLWIFRRLRPVVADML